MRIRKRQVPLPLSSLLPVPLSDLYFNRSPVTTDGGDGGGADDKCRVGALPPHHPSDLSDGLIRRWGIDGLAVSDHRVHDDGDGEEKNLKKEGEAFASNMEPKRHPTLSGDETFEGEEECDEVGSKNIDPTAGDSSRVSIFPSQEKQKVVPLKKIREDNIKGTASIIKTKKSEMEDGASKGRKKGRRSNGVLAEGSRCSRVNGRGWRCCQQTLVGYSLCEHHLGKGRLRSMSASAKNKEMMKRSNVDDEKVKKKVKLGMVKARSISSLLGQTSGTEIVALADHYAEVDK